MEVIRDQTGNPGKALLWFWLVAESENKQQFLLLVPQGLVSWFPWGEDQSRSRGPDWRNWLRFAHTLVVVCARA